MRCHLVNMILYVAQCSVSFIRKCCRAIWLLLTAVTAKLFANGLMQNISYCIDTEAAAGLGVGDLMAPPQPKWVEEVPLSLQLRF